MKKLLAIALLMSSCSEQPKHISPLSAELKKLQVIGYHQYVQSYIIPEESKRDDYPQLIDDVYEHPNIRIDEKNNFAHNVSNNCQAVFLSRIWHAYRPVNKDIGGGTFHHEILTYPFLYKATSYNSKDSSSLTIDKPLDDSEYLDLKLNGKSYSIKAGDSLTVMDTLMTRIDSTYCWIQLIVTKQIINFGLISLTDDRLTFFF